MKGIGFYNSNFFVIKSDIELISESIIRILMTGEGERVGQPFFGCNLKSMLFEPDSEQDQNNIKERIQEQIALYETRVVILNVDISDSTESNEVKVVTISFRMTYETDADAKDLSLSIGKGTA
jgi:uncharacterized protein